MGKFAENTSVPVDRTRAEIENTLKRFGASHFAYFNGPDKASIAFRTRERNVRFDLPIPKSSTFRNEDKRAQDLRRRWRALLLSIKAKLSSVESEIETFESAFLAHVVMPDGRTVGEHVSPAIKTAYLDGKSVPLLEGPK